MTNYYTRRSASNNEIKSNTPWPSQDQTQQHQQAQYKNFVKSFQVDSSSHAINKDPSGVVQSASGSTIMNQDIVNKLKSQPPPPPPPENKTVVEDTSSNDAMQMDEEARARISKFKSEHFKQWKEAKKKAGFPVKVDKKLRKRRLNAKLEKVLKPKNAYLIFNELNLKPEYHTKEIPGYVKSYVAELVLDGHVYTGEGNSIASAKMFAADVALKDWFLRSCKKNEIKNEIADSNIPADENTNEKNEPAPWSAVGSYAMHLLFTRWQMNPSGPSSVLSTQNDTISSLSGSIKVESKQSNELVDYIPAENPKFPNNPEQSNPLYVFNLVFPNIVFVEEIDEVNTDQRFHLKCKIKGVIYDATARSKKEAKRQIAVKVLHNYNIFFPENAA